MSRYIDAEKIEEVIRNELPLKYLMTNSYSRAISNGLKIAEILNDIIPTADVEEVNHGEWKKTETRGNCETKAQCSACGDTVIYWCQPYNYCPNCGAKMDGGDK